MVHVNIDAVTKSISKIHFMYLYLVRLWVHLFALSLSNLLVHRLADVHQIITNHMSMIEHVCLEI